MTGIDIVSAPAPAATPLQDDEVLEQLQEATGASFAERLQAGFRKLANSRTHEFPVPDWDGDLVVVAKKLTDEERKGANTTAKTIALATSAVLLRKVPDGPLEELPNGWISVAEFAGHPEWSQSQTIRKVLDNGVRVDAFHTEIVAWMIQGQDEIEAELGGIAASAPEVADAVNAVSLKMCWRSTVGLTEADRGSVIERILTQTVLDLSVERHNAAVREHERAAG